MKLSIKAFSLTCGILWALALFILTWWWILLEPSIVGDKTIIGSIYLGYEVSALGSIIGLVWAFVDGLIAGAIFSWLYNRFVPKKAD